jgi:glycosyltransferase involved in cell wall biosynthesis
VLLLPTWTEGCALVVLEAMACGVIPLVSDASGAPVTHRLDSLVHSRGDEGALTQHLRELMADRSLVDGLSAAAAETAAAMTWSHAGRALVSAYRQSIALTRGKMV